MFFDFFFHAVAFLIAVSIVTIVHEFGHYIVARWCDVKIDCFSVGFGKPLWKRFDKLGTQWQICWIPGGGYVKMFGDDSPDSRPDLNKINNMKESEKRYSFVHKKIWQKFFISAAGPFFNFLLSTVIVFFILIIFGRPIVNPKVDRVLEGSPAYEAGIQSGDLIEAVNNKKINNFAELGRIVAMSTGHKSIKLLVKRGEDHLTVNIIPRMINLDGRGLKNIKAPQVGIVSSTFSIERLSIISAIGYSVKETYDICIMNVVGIKQILLGHRSVNELSGPVKIANMAGHAAKSGFLGFVRFIVIISCGIGFANLLPIPVFDGGHMLCYIVAFLRGNREISLRGQAILMKIGFVMVILLTVFITFNDVRDLAFH